MYIVVPSRSNLLHHVLSSNPPPDFSTNNFMETLFSDNNNDPFSESIKYAAKCAVDHLETFELLA